jgi:hypothetical protein
LRVPDLVVDYIEGPASPDERVWYTGVFKVLPEYDELFAESEPPTHDAWVAAYLEGTRKSVVKTTIRKIEEALKSHAVPARADEAADGPADGLAAVSRFLGGLLAPASGEGAGPKSGPGRGGGAKRAIKLVGAPRWASYEGQDVVVQAFEVNASRSVAVEAALSVRVWGGGETEAPPGAEQPALMGWRDPAGRFHGAGRIAVGPQENGAWEAIVHSPADTVTRIRVREATGGEDA